MSTRKELIASVIRVHACWTSNGDDFTCNGCGFKAIGDWDATVDHRADMIDQALTSETEIDAEIFYGRGYQNGVRQMQANDSVEDIGEAYK